MGEIHKALSLALDRIQSADRLPDSGVVDLVAAFRRVVAPVIGEERA